MNSYQHYTDGELVAVLLQGEKKAFEEIYYRYINPLTQYARKRISDKDDCFEIIQEVFESIWLRHSELAHITILEAYLYRMVKYKIIRYFQHNQVVKKYQDHFARFEVIISELADEEEEVETLRALIKGSMNGLPERCRMVVQLRIDENLTNGDIAKRMNIDKATVKRYMTSALKYFRKLHSPLYKSRF
ncbi:sigma-70 family RNA polymerase sigma factor [Chryseosolibacter indicus]|uniref:Sigma-70 family RNA polymerase sigma factor n=1 Tax=Chryseosolibacter indicus TaxID=2782351 RepID=A0ABS5VZG4_9BACT|nr:sigma-70 family RNA polymerase sigma factor [Chryseosolibacter indicus]MBT1706304.1 sigma-70 family RNA polymerase sigma factor [Chryseosolibacter indicus]